MINSTIESLQLPAVSQKFYDRLVTTFPPLDPLDINKDTSMIDIQRSAAQQEVLQYIYTVVRKEGTAPPDTLWGRFKYIINRR